MDKIRSSRELKESIDNVTKVIDNNVNIDPVVAIDPVMVDAIDQNKATEEYVAEIVDELTKAAEDVIEDSPEAKLTVKNDYTKQLTLDESIEDFRLIEDGRKNRIAARDESEGDIYLEYNMLEFVYELLSAGSKGITNIAPKTPLVHRSKGPGKPAEMLPMKKFSPNGSQIINKAYVALLDLAPTQSREISSKINRLPEDVAELIQKYAHKGLINEYTIDDVFTQLCDKVRNMMKRFDRDVIGYAFLNHLKTLGSPQISEAGDSVVVYSDDLEDFIQAAEGLAEYGITCEAPVPKRSKTSHWDYSMVVNVPSYDDGEPMMFEDWLAENNLEVEDVMDSAVAKRFRNRFAKADKENAQVLKKIAFDKWVTYAFNHGDEDLDDIYAKMCDDLTSKGVECDQKFYKSFMKEFEDDYSDEDDNSNLVLDEN